MRCVENCACVYKDGDVSREEDENADTRDEEGGEDRERVVGDASSESGRSVDQHGYLGESDDQVLTVNLKLANRTKSRSSQADSPIPAA